MCSTTRGPAICPSLVTWPTSINRDAAVRLAKLVSSCALARTWLTEPGAASTVSQPHGLNRIDDGKVGVSALQRRQGCRAGSFRRRASRRCRPAPRRWARHADLRRRLFARDVDHLGARAGETGRPPLATEAWISPMPGSPAHQRGRGGHEAARPEPGRIPRCRRSGAVAAPPRCAQGSRQADPAPPLGRPPSAALAGPRPTAAPLFCDGVPLARRRRSAPTTSCGRHPRRNRPELGDGLGHVPGA